MTPTVLVPGLLCTAEVFAPQVNALWPHGAVTVASTLEGATIAEMAAAILADAPPRFALGGISMGGYVCLEIMRQARERVDRLALISTSARPDLPEQTALRRALVAEARANGLEAAVKPLMANFLHPSRRDDAGLAEVNLRMALTVGLDGFVRQQEAIIARVDSRPSLAAIGVPTLVLVGDADPLTLPEFSREMAAAISGARLVVVPECGHLSTLERPEAVNRALVEWIAG